MANVSSSAPQWADEGKARSSTVVGAGRHRVRFQGVTMPAIRWSSTAKPTSWRCYPGVLRPSKLAVVGNGVVFDPQAFLDEVAKLKAQGVAVSPENLRVAETSR